MLRLAEKKPVLFALGLSALVLSSTADERVFGLITDGQIITRTAFSMVELGEIGIARGHGVNIPRPGGDKVTRYGLGPSLVRTLPFLLARRFESLFGRGASQTLFVLEQILLILLAALSAGALASSWGGGPRETRRAILACALASPLWGYVSSDFSEPIQAAAIGGAFAFAALSRRGEGAPRLALLASALAGACSGFALLSKSIFLIVVPIVLAAVVWEAPPSRVRRVRHVVAFTAGCLPPAIVWLAFEVVRFGRPFASYEGEHFNHPVFDGLWRLTLGANKGLILYFPLSVLAALGLKRILRRDRVMGFSVLAFVSFLLVSTAAWWSWHGAAGWGPRLLVPSIPLLAALAAVAAATTLPKVVFPVLFALGVAVNAIGALQPDAPTTWSYMILSPRVLSPSEAQEYPRFAVVRDAEGRARLGPWFEVSLHAELSQVRFSLWLLEKRLRGADVEQELLSPPWRTDAPGQEVALPLRKAIPAGVASFLTAPFRWPHLGMSLWGRSDAPDNAFAFLDALYEQVLRAQDMKRGDRAVEFGEELYERDPGPQSAAALAEGLRLLGRREAFERLLKELPAAFTETPGFVMVRALFARDAGDDEAAVALLNTVLSRQPRPEFKKLALHPPREWPATIREITSSGPSSP